MKRHDYLMKAAMEMGIPLLMAGEAVATTELAHPPGWADVEVDPETGEDLSASSVHAKYHGRRVYVEACPYCKFPPGREK